MNGKDSRTVSVIMPTKGRVDLVRRAVNSVLGQTYGTLELLILDDSGKDDGRRIMELASSDSRIQYSDRGGIGVSAARSLGVHKARGSFLTFLDSDDYWADGRLKHHTDVWADNHIGLSWDLCEEIGGQPKLVRSPFSGGLIEAPKVARKLYMGNFIHASSGFTRTDFARKIDFSWTILSDWFLFMKLAESRAAFFIDETLSFRSVEQRDRVSNIYSDRFFFKESRKVRTKALLSNPAVYAPAWVERSWFRFKRKMRV
jgi:glycosyltransferase involved in cell wall biosynthesis